MDMMERKKNMGWQKNMCQMAFREADSGAKEMKLIALYSDAVNGSDLTDVEFEVQMNKIVRGEDGYSDEDTEEVLTEISHVFMQLPIQVRELQEALRGFYALDVFDQVELGWHVTELLNKLRIAK